jgi:succinate dehydrogenase / fumarate reductase cytochrome b subunit
MADATPGIRARPLSPHVQVWRWHVTMAASILTRVTGSALYGGAILLMGWAVALASGPVVYDGYAGLLGSIPGKIALFGLTLSAFYHLFAGLRHLVWDSGKGFAPAVASRTAWAAIGCAVVASLVVWTVAGLMGKL